MTTLPLKVNGRTITVQRMAENNLGDHTYTDHQVITGCMDFPSFSTTGRISLRAENTAGGGDVVTNSHTLYAPFGSDVLATDRVILHPPGQDTALDPGDPARTTSAYQVMGTPMDWKNLLTGWAPGMEIALQRIT